VISGFPIDFDLVVKICDPRLGRVKTYPKLRLIDLELSALHDSKVTNDLRNKLSNPQNPRTLKKTSMSSEHWIR
jgi:hypothetical protein